MQNVLVTGGAGFIGSHVVRAFLAQGASVTVLDNLTSGKRKNLPDGVSFVEDDIRSPEASRLVCESGFDVICHLAAQIDVRKSVLDPAFDVDVNIGGTVRLLEAVRASGKSTTRFIFSSTGGALYGDLVTLPTPEGAAKDPQSPYGNAKLSVEYYMGYFGRVHGLNTVALRYGNVYGPRQDSHGEAGVVAIFCERILDGRALTIFGDGKQTRDYVYAGDVAQANLLAATRNIPAAGSLDVRAFNVGTGVETDVVTLATMLKDIAGAETAVDHAPERAGEVRRSALDAAKTKHSLGWRPDVTLHEGLAETYRWFAGEHESVSRPVAVL
ncbi:MAG TPA: NAD-dependent epimerase/dehydratase family protein [Gemmatimonadaceae bacterium]|jgi:UDP-glucose 4-epimerase|nr:NAD-dependent epimerase/dehydratase family protein [Gemmatimonadaceae bacterium]